MVLYYLNKLPADVKYSVSVTNFKSRIESLRLRATRRIPLLIIVNYNYNSMSPSAFFYAVFVTGNCQNMNRQPSNNFQVGPKLVSSADFL